MYTAKNVSVVIPSYDSQATLAACLDALVGGSQLPGEIIVVDSSPGEASRAIVHQYPMVKLCWVRSRIFPGPARNKGVALACGAIIAFIDADCIAAPDWIERIVAGHNQGHAVVGGAIEVGNQASLTAWAGHLGEFREFLPLGEARPVLHIPTSNISYRKDLFEAHGGFPDAYYPQEDLLFNYLLNQSGVKIWFDPALRIRHFCREGLQEFLSHQHRIGRVTRSTLTRIPMPGSAVATRPWLAMLAAPLLGLVKFLRTAAVFTRRYPGEALRRPGLLVLILLGAIWWARGFAAGARLGLSGIKGWNDPDEPIFARLAPTVGAPNVGAHTVGGAKHK